MKKLIRGVVEFREKVRPRMLDKFEELALGQRPDVLLVTCSDSRVAVNVFASTDPGDMFVLRNLGNILPPMGSSMSTYTKAALDFTFSTLNIRHIVVCGHSECGAMIAIKNGLDRKIGDGLYEWLQNGIQLKNVSMDHNQLSKLNVLKQLDQLLGYPEVKKRAESGTLKLHGWWFDIKSADVYHYSFDEQEYKLIDADQAEALLNALGE